jgi:AcrR family transcriptional regulator
MPKVTQEHLDARRRQILVAAGACFSRSGFHLSTMQDICKAASLSPGAVYRYFSSKDEIIKAIAEENRENNMRMIADIKSRGLDAKTAMDQLVDLFFTMIDRFDDYPAKLSIELWAETFRNKNVRRMQAETFQAYHDIFVDFIQSGQKAGEINPDIDPSSMARIMISFFDGLLVQKAVDRSVDVWRYVATMREVTSVFYANTAVPQG